MTTSVLEHDHLSWSAHAHIDVFSAQSERDAMHILFPLRAAAREKAIKRGYKVPRWLDLHVTGDQMEALNFPIIGVRDEPGNLLVNAGINRLGSLLIAGGGQGYDATHTAIGVGDTTTTATATDTDLAATVNSANRYVQVADSTYPTFATQVLTVKSTFATGNANMTGGWQEWAIGQNTASGANAMTAPLLNRKVVNLGTKTSAAAWAFTVTVTLS